MTPEVQIALISLGGVCITAVVGPAVVAVVNHLITSRNETKQKGLDVAKAQDRRIKDQERTIRGQRRRIRALMRERVPRVAQRPTATPTRKGDRP